MSTDHASDEALDLEDALEFARLKIEGLTQDVEQKYVQAHGVAMSSRLGLLLEAAEAADELMTALDEEIAACKWEARQ
jgi:hypothetical protein